MVIVSIGLLGTIIYFLVSPKSSRLLRISAIIALALIGLTLGVCGIILIKGPSQSQETIPLPFLIDGIDQPAKKTNVALIVTFLAAFSIITGLVIYSYRKEQLRKDVPVKAKKEDDSQLFQSGDDLNIKHTSGDDDSFDLGLD